MKKDSGHERLIEDIKALLYEAENKEFHDYQNTKYPTPKMALANHLHDLRNNVMNGKYDNEI